MPLSVKDGMGAWIKDFQKSDAPQFKGKSDKERRDMAIAAYMDAKRGGKNEAYDNPPFVPDPKKKSGTVTDKSGAKHSPMSKARELARRARDAQKTESTDAYGKSMDAIANKKKTDAMTSSDKDKLGKLADMMAKEKKPKKEAYRPPTQAEIDADKRKENRGKSRPSMTAKSATRNVYKNYMGGLKKESVELEEKYSWNDVNSALTKANYMRGNPAEISKVAKHFDHKSGNDKKFSHADVKKNLSKAGIDAARHHDVMKHMKESVELDEANDMYKSAAQELKSYADKRGGMDKKDFHTAAKHIENIGRANVMNKGQHLAKLSKHLRDLDTSPREKVLSVLNKHGHEVGNYMPGVKMKRPFKEAVRVDELKKSTLGSYIKKASQDASSKAYRSAMDAPSTNKAQRKSSGDSFAKSLKRQKGIERATDRLTKETTSKKIEEAAQFKVDIEGLPATFIQGKSSAEILANLRKIVKQPSMIKGVERYTDMEVKKAYRQKAQGRPVGEAKEDDMPASPDEASMALTQLEFIEYAAEEMEEHIKKGGRFPEWMQNKLSAAHEAIEGLHSALGDHGEDDDEKETNESTVNEISADLAKKYYKKATAPGATKPASDMGHTKDSMRKTHNRVVGSNRALDRMFNRKK